MPGSYGQVHAHVDFNEMEADGRFFVLPDDVSGSLALRLPVVLRDAEGNSASGIVVELLDGGRAMLAMIAGSWRAHDAIAASSFSQGFQDQVASLTASFAQNLAAPLYKLSAATSGVAGLIADRTSVVAQPRGAVASSL